MLDLSRYRILDLSRELIPGERRVNGEYLHGIPAAGRSLEVAEFRAMEARMHFIEGQTHLGTHVEAPYKYADGGADAAALPLSACLGPAAACNLTSITPGAPITAAHFRQYDIRPGDIVLAWGSASDEGAMPHLAPDSIDYLIRAEVKLVGIDTIEWSEPGTPWGMTTSDARLLQAGVIVADGLTGLHQIRRERVLFIGLPLRMQRVTATWVRAVALEEKTGEAAS